MQDHRTISGCLLWKEAGKSSFDFLEEGKFRLADRPLLLRQSFQSNLALRNPNAVACFQHEGRHVEAIPLLKLSTIIRLVNTTTRDRSLQTVTITMLQRSIYRAK